MSIRDFPRIQQYARNESEMIKKVFHVKGDREKSGVIIPSYNMPFKSIVTLRETQRNIIYLFLKCQYAEKMWGFYTDMQQMAESPFECESWGQKRSGAHSLLRCSPETYYTCLLNSHRPQQELSSADCCWSSRKNTDSWTGRSSFPSQAFQGLWVHIRGTWKLKRLLQLELVHPRRTLKPRQVGYQLKVTQQANH